MQLLANHLIELLSAIFWGENNEDLHAHRVCPKLLTCLMVSP